MFTDNNEIQLEISGTMISEKNHHVFGSNTPLSTALSQKECLKENKYFELNKSENTTY